MPITRSDYFRFRTHASGLTDDELIHFDWFAKMAMYDCWAPPIFAEDANLSMNLAFPPHTMEDEVLKVRLEQWHQDGLFRRNVDEDDGRLTYYLTSAGGALWAAERLPVWDCYHAWESAVGDGWLFVTAPDRKIARQQLRSAIASGYIRSYKRPKTYRLRNCPDEDFPWPRFKRAWQLRIRVKRDNGLRPPDWERYEKERTGWSTPEKLISLRLSGKLPWPTS
ncbi:hypothetical protein [Armatimonas sp.]|uniref:hypothetical protein n=1 Tax=Armatimonas sp. TaxID=1872638 RepID=UPI00374CB30D